MKKNFNYKGTAARTKEDKNDQWVIWFVLLLMVFCVSLWFTYQQRGLLVAYVDRAKIWVTAHKDNLHHGIKQIKKVVVKKHEPAPEVHFEFYTALADMQIKPKEPQDPVAPKPKSPITSAEQIEHEFSKEFKRELNNDL